MYNKRSLSVIAIFLVIFAFVLYKSLNSSKGQLNQTGVKGRKSIEISTFKGVHYFRSVDLKPNFELRSTKLKITNNDLLDFEKPTGILVGTSKNINYSANLGHMYQKSKQLKLSGEVHLSDEKSDYVSDYLRYDGEKKIVYADGNVSSQMVDEKTLDIIKVKSDKLVSHLKTENVHLSGKVNGRIIRKRRYESGLKFKSEIANLNSLESRLDLLKSVKIRRDNYYLRAERAEIFLENYNKKLKYYVLYDDVKLEEKLRLKSGKRQTRKAYSEKLEGHLRSGKVVLTGAPRVEQGSDTIKGYQITLRENVELVEVDDAQSSFSLKKDKND